MRQTLAKCKNFCMREKQFITNTRYACQDILNRYYSIQVAQQKMPPDPWWISKIQMIEKNCGAILNDDDQYHWERDFAEKTKENTKNK